MNSISWETIVSLLGLLGIAKLLEVVVVALLNKRKNRAEARGEEIDNIAQLQEMYSAVLKGMEELRGINKAQWATIDDQNRTIHSQNNKLQLQEGRIRGLERWKEEATTHMDEMEAAIKALPDGARPVITTRRPNGKHEKRHAKEEGN